MLELNAGPSAVKREPEKVAEKAQVKRQQQQRTVLSSFMVRNFLRGIFLKHVHLFIPDNEQGAVAGMQDGMLQLNFDRKKSAHLFEMILKRARSTVLQFKRVCCIIIKFLECCKNETNYMRHLRYDLHKLIVAAFVLSVPNVSHNDGNRILIREKSYSLYSKVTGLSVAEITNCCSVVRPVIMRRSRKQHEHNSHMQQSQGAGSPGPSGSNNSPAGGTGGTSHNTPGAYSDDSHDDGAMSYNQFLEMAQRNIDIHSVNYNIGTTFPLPQQLHYDDDTLPSQTSSSYPYSSSSDSPPYQHAHSQVQPLRLPNGERYTISMLHELHSPELNRVRSNHGHGHGHGHGRSERVHLSNGYVLSAEIEQFNQMGKQLVTESFQVV